MSESKIVEITSPSDDVGSKHSKYAFPSAVICWYVFSTLYNIQTKVILRNFPAATFTLIISQVAIGSLLSLLCIRVFTISSGDTDATTSEDVQVKPSRHRQHAVLGGLHAAGSFSTTYSLARTSVSLVQTIKAAEPIFALTFIRFLAPSKLSLTVKKLNAVFMVIFGVSLSTVKDADFDSLGIVLAVCANASFQLRNVLAKYKFSHHQTKRAAEKFLQFSKMTTWATVVFLPIWAADSIWRCSGGIQECLMTEDMFMPLAGDIVCASILHFGYQASSFIVLASVAPLTHSLLNVIKRALIIFSSIIVIGNSPGTLSYIGSCFALIGSFLYSLPSGQVTKMPENAGKLPGM